MPYREHEVSNYITGKATIECPFCKKVAVTAFFKPSYRQGKTSRISAGAKTTYHRVDEKYFIQGDCPNCGAKNKHIQDWYDGKEERRCLTHEERLKRIREAGLPTVIES